MARASRYVRPGVYFRCCFFPSSLSATFPSFCSTIGVMTMLFAPRSFIWSRISFSAPLPMASIAITDATPNRMPSDVRPARSLLCATASAAVRALNARWATSARKRDCPSVGEGDIASRSALLRLTGLGGRHRHRLRGVGAAGGRRCVLDAREERRLDPGLVVRRREQHLLALRQPLLHDDLVVVHLPGDDLLLHQPVSVALVDEGEPAVVRHRFERHGE